MKPRLIAVLVALLLLGRFASAHQLDEYLQATLLSIAPDRVDLSLRLIPGVAVAPSVLAAIDTDGDGVLSAPEQQAYARRVIANLTLTLDASVLQPRLVALSFPTVSDIQEGLGEIHLTLTAPLPPGGQHRTLLFINRHHPERSAYLVNAVLPRDPRIRILAQQRDPDQSVYQLDYEQGPVALSSTGSTGLWSRLRLPVASAGFTSLFRLGTRHIAGGTDHLLFLLTLLLPAPLLAAGSRWTAVAGVRRSLLEVLRIVTAFTLGHSLTLALAAFGVVRLPSRPIEVLIAVSILASALHALRPIFPGREPVIAASFGLVHGLAFATVLGSLGLGSWQRVSGVLAFNLGIEAMQLLVVAAILPSLLLLSRTRLYTPLRIAGASFAAVASAGWILERSLGLGSVVDLAVNALARHAVPLAVGLFLLSLLAWLVTARHRRVHRTAGPWRIGSARTLRTP